MSKSQKLLKTQASAVSPSFSAVLHSVLQYTPEGIRNELRAAGLNATGQGHRLYLRYLAFKLLKHPANLDTQLILDLFLLSPDIRGADKEVKLDAIERQLALNAQEVVKVRPASATEESRSTVIGIINSLKPILEKMLPEYAGGKDVSMHDVAYYVLYFIYEMRLLPNRQPESEINLEKWLSELLGYERTDVVPTASTTFDNLMTKIDQRDKAAESRPTETDKDTGRSEVKLARNVLEPEQPLYRRWLLSILNKTIHSKKTSDIMKARAEVQRDQVQLGEKTDLNSFVGSLFQQGAMNLGDLFEGGIHMILDFKTKYNDLVAKQEKARRLYEAAKFNIATLIKNHPYDPSKPSRESTSAFVDATSISDSPVVAIRHKCSDSSQLIDIGLRSDGFWRFDGGVPDAKAVAGSVSFFPESAHRLVWSAHPVESGRPLDTILCSPAPDGGVLSEIYLLFEDDFIRVDLDLDRRVAHDEHTHLLARTETATTLEAPCTFLHLPCTDANDKPAVFLRLALRLRPQSSTFRQMFRQLCKLSKDNPLQESGSLLANLMEKEHEAAQSGESPFSPEAFSSTILMYRTTSAVRSAAIPHLTANFREFVPQLLGQQRATYDSESSQEAREILKKLILAAPKENHVAIITEDHAQDLSVFLAEELVVGSTSFTVEPANLLSVMRNLQKLMRGSTLTFCFIRITSPISATEMSRLVDFVQGSNVRLLILNSYSVLPSLRMVGLIGSVRLPESLKATSAEDEASIVKYPLASASNTSVICNYDRFSQSFAEGPFIRADEFEFHHICRIHHIEREWKERVDNWLHAGLSDSLLMLISERTSGSEPVFNYLKTFSGSAVKVFNCRKLSWGELKSSMESFLTSKSGSDIHLSHCVVLADPHLLPETHVGHVAEKCADHKARLVFVVAQPLPRLLRLCITKMRSSGPVVRCLHGWQAAFASSSEVPIETQLRYRALKLLLGPLLAHLDVAQTQILTWKFWTDSCSVISDAEPTISETVVRDLFENLEGLDNVGEQSLKSLQLEPPLVVVCRLAYSFIERCSHRALQEVSFWWFTQNDPMAQFLTQADRIDRWIWTILLQDVHIAPFPLLNRKGIQNIHSPHLVASFPGPEERPVPDAAFRVVQHNASLSYQEFLLHQCIQAVELPWDELKSTWSVFPYSTEVLVDLLSSSYQPFKLLSLLPPSSLHLALDSVVGMAPANASPCPATALLKYLVEFAVEPALEQTRRLIGSAYAPSFASWVSVIRWTVFRYYVKVVIADSAVAKKIFGDNIPPLSGEDIQLLINEHIPLEIPTSSADASAAVVERLVSLDGSSNVISQEVPLRSFFLTLPDDLVAYIASPKFRSPIGRVFIEFLLSPFVMQRWRSLDREDAGRLSGERSQDGSLLRRFDYVSFISWMDAVDDVSASSQKPGSADLIKSSLSLNLSEESYAFLFSRCTQTIQAQALAALIRGRIRDVEGFLVRVLRHLHKNDHVAAQVLTIMDGLKLAAQTKSLPLTESDKQIPLLSIYAKAWEAITLPSFSSIQTTAHSDSWKRLNIPMWHPCLLRLYLSEFSDSKIGFPENCGHVPIQDHLTWFPDSSFQVVQSLISEDLWKEYRFLLFLHGLRTPYLALPDIPRPEEMEMVRRIVREANIVAEVMKLPQQASSLSLYLTLPYCVDSIVRQDLSSKMGGTADNSVTFISGQELPENKKILPFFTTVREHPLPGWILQNFSQIRYRIEVKEKADVVDLSYDLASGVEGSIITQNLQALADIPVLLKHPDGACEEVANETKAAVAACIILWFRAMGVSFAELRTWRAIATNHSLRDRMAKVDTLLDSLNIHCSLTLPLPSVLDVSLRLSSPQTILGTGTENFQFTLQLFSTILGAKTAQLTHKISCEFQEGPTSSTYEGLPEEVLSHFLGSYGSDMPPVSAVDSFMLVIKKIHQADRDGKCHRPNLAEAMLRDCLQTLSNIKPHDVQAQICRLMFSAIGLSSDRDRDLLEQFWRLLLDCQFTIDSGSVTEYNYALAVGLLSFPSTPERQFELPNDPRLHKSNGQLPLQLSKKHLLADPPVQENSMDPPSYAELLLGAIGMAARTEPKVAVQVAAEEDVDPHASGGYRFRFTQLSDSQQSTAQTENELNFRSKGRSRDEQYLFDELTIDCCELLVISFEQSYALLKVLPGDGGEIISSSADQSVLKFKSFTSNSRKELVEQSSGSRAFSVRAHFSSNGEAWDAINRTSAPYVLLLLHGMRLFRTEQRTWQPIISLQKTIQVWDALWVSRLARLPVWDPTRDPVREFLLHLCRMMLDAHPEHRDTPSAFAMDERDLLTTLRFLAHQEHLHGETRLLTFCSSLFEAFRMLGLTQNVEPSLAPKAAALSAHDRIDALHKELKASNHPAFSLFEKDATRKAFADKLQACLNKNMLLEIETILQSSNPSTRYMNLDDPKDAVMASELDRLSGAGEGDPPESSIASRLRSGYYSADDVVEPKKTEELEPSEPVSSDPHPKLPVGVGDLENSTPLDFLTYGEATPSLTFYSLQYLVHKNAYHAVSGQELAYILPRRVTRGTVDVRYVKWLVDVLRSDLPTDWKEWFVDIASREVSRLPPSLKSYGKKEALMIQIVAVSLARSCPVQGPRRRLQGTCSVPRHITLFCERRDNRYGVHFCNSHTLTKLRHVGIDPAIVDLGAIQDAPTDDLYLQMIAPFEGLTCFVYIRGLRTVPDLLLKWCCEYTERCPWRFFYFENTDNMFNFSENRDRCLDIFYDRPTVAELSLPSSLHELDIYTVNFHTGRDADITSAFESLLDQVADLDLKASAKVNWESGARELCASDRPFILLLTSPPGAGKTHFFEDIIRDWCKLPGTVAERLDCSNDELVERTMHDALSLRFTGEKRRILLIADEFHMLTNSQKFDLVRWALPRLSSLRLVMIGNRYDDFDTQLLDQLSKQVKDIHVEHISARLGVDQILEVLTKKGSPPKHVVQKVNLWSRSARALFGDEVLTHRNRFELTEIFSTNNSHRLSELLLAKMPNLGTYTCRNFAREFLSLASRAIEDERVIRDFSANCHPLQTLLRVAMLPGSDALLTYPDFVNRVPVANKYHPLVRLAAWSMLIIKKLAPAAVAHITHLWTLRLIDQVGFPLILQLSADHVPLTSSLAFGKTGNYNDLDWLKNVIQHGYSLNWAAVKLTWQHSFVTDIAKFGTLLSVSPSPTLCLGSLVHANLCDMIEKSDVKFARTVRDYYERSADELNDPHSPFFASLWFLGRDSLLEPLPKDIDACSTFFASVLGDAVGVTPSSLLTILQLFSWASRFGLHRTGVRPPALGSAGTHPVAPVAKTKLMILQNILIICSQECMKLVRHLSERGDLHISQLHQLLIDIWTGGFASCLVVSDGSSVGVDFSTCLLLADFSFPPHSSWPPLLKQLCRICFSRCDTSDLGSFREHRILYQGGKFAFPSSRFFEGVLSVPALDIYWQMKILEHIENSDLSPVPASLSTDGALLLKHARKLEHVIRKNSHKISESKPLSLALKAMKALFDNTAAPAPKSATNVRRNVRDKQMMEHISKMCDKPKILYYYNQYAGMSMEKIVTLPTYIAMDAKDPNPRGSEFDLGRDERFSEFRILVGNFYRQGRDRLRYEQFYETAGKALNQKGFRFSRSDWVESEREFINRLNARQSDLPDQIWIFSSTFTDWQYHTQSSAALPLTEVQEFVDAAERYVASGRGLFLLAENDPLFYHANIILERLCGHKVQLEGNFEGGEVLKRGGAWNEDFDKLSNAGRGILSGLENLYEGTTIAEFKALDGDHSSLQTLVHNSRKKSAIAYRDIDDEKRGRILVDTGYTKIWEGWLEAGTARYFMNAAVWLLALDFRIGHASPDPEHPFVRGPLKKDPRLRLGSSPKILPPLSGRLIDVIFVLDKSGSVGDGWLPTVQFLEAFVNSSAVRIAEWAVNVGVLCFDAAVSLQLDLTHDKSTLAKHISVLKSACANGGGTLFNKAMAAVDQMFGRSKRKNPLRILVFETDGVDFSDYMRSKDNIDTLIGVCVGRAARPDLFESKMIRNPGDNVLTVDNFANLTQIVSSIVENVRAGRA